MDADIGERAVVERHQLGIVRMAPPALGDGAPGRDKKVCERHDDPLGDPFGRSFGPDHTVKVNGALHQLMLCCTIGKRFGRGPAMQKGRDRGGTSAGGRVLRRRTTAL
jgi:hypothetical protein